MNKELEQSQKQLVETLIGSKVELVIALGLYKGTYASRLEELENGLIGLSHPTLRGALLPTFRSTELLMKIDGSGCYYQATASVIRSTVNVPVPLLWVKPVSDLEKVQRRMFVRVPCSIKADAFCLKAGEDPVEGAPSPQNIPKEWFPVRVSDISLGGVGVSVKKELVSRCIEGGRYLLSLNISGTTFFLVGKLVKILQRDASKTEIGLAYEGLSTFLEKLMGGYIRQQEFITRG
ncbi:MAG: flagellar brake domain-containing protein [Synergistaceae bacterium]|jgi:c-di-GMP-binding flagellar brake protein YcgR|nr:flagellar brake domain-containing protein [Synergistaceae bacterium]